MPRLPHVQTLWKSEYSTVVFAEQSRPGSKASGILEVYRIRARAQTSYAIPARYCMVSAPDLMVTLETHKALREMKGAHLFTLCSGCQQLEYSF